MSKILCINEGFASGITDGMRGRDEKTISHYVLPIIFNKYKINPLGWKEIHSTRISSRRRMRTFIKDKANGVNDLILVTKSFGCKEAIDFALSGSGKAILKRYGSVKWFIVDANRGRLSRKPRRFDLIGLPPNVEVFPFYQRRKTPWGAEIVCGKPNVDLTAVEGMDHFKIVYDPRVLDAIERFC